MWKIIIQVVNYDTLGAFEGT